MRTPVGSSNNSARSLRHSSPLWLPNGVTLTSPDDWPLAVLPNEVHSMNRMDAATTTERKRIRPPRPPRSIYLPPTHPTYLASKPLNN